MGNVDNIVQGLNILIMFSWFLLANKLLPLLMNSLQNDHYCNLIVCLIGKICQMSRYCYIQAVTHWNTPTGPNPETSLLDERLKSNMIGINPSKRVANVWLIIDLIPSRIICCCNLVTIVGFKQRSPLMKVTHMQTACVKQGLYWKLAEIGWDIGFNFG